MTERGPRKESIQDLLIEGMEISFNPKTLLFEAGAATFTPEQPHHLRQHVYKNGDKPTGKELMFIIGSGDMVIMPELRKFLAGVSKDPQRRNLLRRKVSRVMEEVADGKTLGLWTDDEEFNLLTHRMTDVDSRGLMRFETAGACACYRAEMGTMGIYSPAPDVLTDLSLPIGMSPHNIETDRQLKIVTAGAASVAYFAKYGFED